MRFFNWKNKHRDKNSIIYLFHGSQIIKLLKNSILSLRKINKKIDIYIFCDEQNSKNIKIFSKKHHCKLVHLDIDLPNKDLKFKSNDWNILMKKKVDAIITILNKGYKNVIYSDCDIVFLHDVENYIQSVSKVYNIGVQSNSQNVFPVEYCPGFMFFNQKSKYFLNLLKIKKSSGSDQFLFNKVVSKNYNLIKEIFILPKSIFPNGLHYKNFFKKKIKYVLGYIKPYIFHANYVLGINNKIKLLRKLSLWHL